MEPATHNLNIYRDRDFSQTFLFKSSGSVMNLAGYEARAEIRQAKDSLTLIVAFTLVMDEVLGKITISLTDVQTLALRGIKLFWDLVLTDTNGLRQNYVQGTANIIGTVTREVII